MFGKEVMSLFVMAVLVSVPWPPSVALANRFSVKNVVVKKTKNFMVSLSSDVLKSNKIKLK